MIWRSSFKFFSKFLDFWSIIFLPKNYCYISRNFCNIWVISQNYNFQPKIKQEISNFNLFIFCVYCEYFRLLDWTQSWRIDKGSIFVKNKTTLKLEFSDKKRFRKDRNLYQNRNLKLKFWSKTASFFFKSGP